MDSSHINRNVIILAAVLTVSFFGWVAWATCTFSGVDGGNCFSSKTEKRPTEVETVTFIIDGDSFTVTGGEQIRLIGIDAPERGEDYYDEAKTFLTELIDGKKIALESGLADEDKYNRKLRYAYTDVFFVNEEMVKAGYAEVLTIPPNVRYYDVLEAAEKRARKERRGMWSKEQ